MLQRVPRTERETELLWTSLVWTSPLGDQNVQSKQEEERELGGEVII